MLRITLFSCLLFTALLAHKVNLFAYDEEGILYIQSYFTKSSPCKQCPIKIFGENEKELATLTTNDEGKVSMKLPAASFSILVEAGMGHQQSITYQAKSHTKEEAKKLPSDTPVDKMALGLAIIVFFFGVLYWFKKHPRPNHS